MLVAGVVAWLGPTASAQPQFWGDNGKIAFTSTRDGNEAVFAMTPDGSHQKNLSQHSAPSDSDPAWSPGAAKIAFESNRDGDGEIFKMNADGSHQRQLTHNTTPDFHAGVVAHPASRSPAREQQ